MKVVADTNVMVSALIFPGGSPEAFYRVAFDRRIELVTSRPLLAELGRVLTEKFGWEPEGAEEAVGQVIRLAEVVDPQETLSEIEADPADNRVLEAAMEGRADAIVSGDGTCSRSVHGGESGSSLRLRSSSRAALRRPEVTDRVRKLREQPSFSGRNLSVRKPACRYGTPDSAGLNLLRLDHLIDMHRPIEVWDRAFAEAPQRWRVTVTLE